MKCGYGKAEFTPAPGQYLQGNPTVRVAAGAFDPLNVRCVAFEQEKLAFVLTYDLVGLSDELVGRIRKAVSDATGCEEDAVLASATHTHTAPNVDSTDFPIDSAFLDTLPIRGAEAAKAAQADLRPAKMFAANTAVAGVTCVRRYRMKDGVVRTNPGVCNPDILEPMTEADETVRVVRVKREGAGDVILINFQMHPDIIKRGMPEPLYSADYPGILCDAMERMIPDSKCIYLNGTCGNLNHTNAMYRRLLDTGVEEAQLAARTVARSAMSVYAKAEPIADGPVKTFVLRTSLPLRRDTPEEIEHAKQINEWYRKGEKEKIGEFPTVMEYYTALYEAKSRIKAAKLGEYDVVPVSGLAIGDFCIVGIPGEPFCEIGKEIRAASPFKMQFTMGLTNGSHGYFPMKDAFEVNGYESRTSVFKPGIGERFIDAGIKVVKRLHGDE